MRFRGLGLRCTGVWAALVLGSLAAAGPAAAGGVVGDGTPESCTEAAFAAALAGGGVVTFACGLATHTIVLTATHTLAADTTIDGDDEVILSGGNLVRPLAVAPGVTVTLQDVAVINGNAAEDGGCVVNAGTLVVRSATVQTCTAGRDGGGIFNDAGATLVVENGSTVRGNVAGRHGGGIYDGGTSTTIDGSTVTSNDAASDGGGVYVTGSLTLDGAFVTVNVAQRGGGIFAASGTVTLDGSTVSGNLAPVAGAGIYNGAAATLDVTGGEIRNNANATGGSVLGGGLHNEGTATLWRVTIRTNSAARGGAIDHEAGMLSVLDSTISANIATAGGGLAALAPAEVTNSTFSGNLGIVGAAMDTSADVWLQNVSVVDNRSQAAPTGSGLRQASGTLALRNTVVALNFPADCFGTITSAGHNLASDGSCALTEPGDMENQAPQVSALLPNGGSTRTHLPWLGSPLVDAGTATGCPATDQRGIVRPIGSACDIGAVERQPGDPTPPTTTVTSTSTSTSTSSAPPTTSTSVPSTTSTSVTSTTSTSLPPTTSTSVPSTTSTSVPTTTSTSVPPTTSTSLPPTTTSTTSSPSTSTTLATSTTTTSTTATVPPPSTTTTTETVTTVTSTVTSTSLPPKEVCANTLDDDGDGQVDCLDWDCALAPACPAACGEQTRFSVLRCRVEALAMRTAAVTDREPFASDAQAMLGKATESAEGAEVACGDGDRRAAKRLLRRLGKRARQYYRKLDGRAGRDAIPAAEVRYGLRYDAAAIRLISKALRRYAACRPTP
ncbi:MAG TPA: choice-of-anchor Q domain-containing protein [Candidatus Limnocylindria bacterium]|nr:choice-of-anchor Q domain-containing protein [Candidatus Limnocylindria bacterium]